MNKKIFLFFILLMTLTGCKTNQDDEFEFISFDKNLYNTKGLDTITCRRDTTTEDGSTVDIQYKVYYGEEKNVEILTSYEKVTSSSSEVLDQYQEAYDSIYSVYDDLKYYDHETKRDKNSVTSVTYINYGKIDMDKLMKIEGTEDNVKVIDGKIKLDDWKEFARKYGTECNSNS